MIGQVYVNHGRVIVDCPTACGNAYAVMWGYTAMACDAEHSGCGEVFGLDIPSNLSDILSELSKRPRMANRNWFPEAHPVAVKANLEMGQSPSDLAAEFEIMAGGS